MSRRGHGCERRSILAAPPHSFALYVQRPCLWAHTVGLDGLWQRWYERQVAGFELIRAQTKTGQAAQESWELLQRAKDVQNLSEWQKEAIENAMLELEDVTPLGLLGAFRLCIPPSHLSAYSIYPQQITHIQVQAYLLMTWSLLNRLSNY
ncbi:hypothetical protein D6C83_02666 [Aureobasidium pullulans]|uniref:Uncharacterized protein n=1 Tax=Aureobasidium pullulans TaxID=5580 RepID=A0A4T0DQN2_AURPU|nr:hypothetical protein D6C83_02666 [Aureobasidium pullulans]